MRLDALRWPVLTALPRPRRRRRRARL